MKIEFRYYEWLNKKMPYCHGFKSIPFEEWLAQKAGGQFFALAMIKIRPKKIVWAAEEILRPPDIESVVSLEEKVQVSLEND